MVQEPEPKPGTWPWAAQWDDSVPLTAREAMPAAEYVMGRGIRWGPAHDAGARFHPRYGTGQSLDTPDGRRWRDPGPAIVFPLTAPGSGTGTWALTGVSGRYLDGREAQGWRKVQTGGGGGGVFATLGAAHADALVLVEGPMDALAWAQEGVPAIAVGTALPGWLATHVLGRQVILAQDADTAGDAAADRHAPVLTGWGAHVTRTRPPDGCKDWAEAAHRAVLARWPRWNAPAT